MKATFIGIGAQKCASSWLYDILADHPEVTASSKKELDFFSYHYENGYSWYESHFGLENNPKAVGEISPSYFNEASVPERARKYSPDLRILVSLRDPVERALSQHRHMVRVGRVNGPDFTFEAALADNPSYIEQGFYAAHLQRWLQVFPREQIHVVLMEDIAANPVVAATAVYDFLGISRQHRSATLHQKSNASYAVRNRGIESAIKFMRKTIRGSALSPAWDGIGNAGLRSLYRKLNRQASETVIPPPQPASVMALRQTFSDDVKALESLLGRSLATWR